MPFTPEELEAMRLADEEIDREFEERYVADQVDKEISAWLDELAYLESLDHKAAAKFKRQKKYRAAYYAEHKEEIAAKQAAYYVPSTRRRSQPSRPPTVLRNAKSITLICASICVTTNEGFGARRTMPRGTFGKRWR